MTFSIPAQFEGPRLAVGLVRLGIAAVPCSRVSVRNRLHDLAEVIERDHLLCPAAACRVLPVSSREEDPERWRIGNCVLEGAAPERLAGATEVAVVFATIGEAWSDAVSAYFKRGDPLSGYLLDEIGTNALEGLSRRLEAMVRMAAHSSGQRAGSPIEPGQLGLPLTSQPVLVELAEVDSVGIKITVGGMLTPLKSISMLIGIGGEGLRRWTHAEVCRECPSFARCQGRGRISGNGT